MDTMKKVVRKVKSGFLKDMVSELRWILKVAIQYRFRILAYALISILTTAITFFFTFKTKDLVDLLVSQRWKEIVILAVYYVSLGSLNIILSMFSRQESDSKICHFLQGLHLPDSNCLSWLLLGQRNGDEPCSPAFLPPHQGQHEASLQTPPRLYVSPLPGLILN